MLPGAQRVFCGAFVLIQIFHRVHMVGCPRGGHIVFPSLSLEVATPENKINSFKAVIRYARKYAQGTEVRLTSGS